MAFYHRLRDHGGTPALIAADGTAMSYVALADLAGAWRARFEDRAAAIGSRLLVGLEIEAEAEFIAAYLGALAGGHAVLLGAPGDLSGQRTLAQIYRPNLTVQRSHGTVAVQPGSDDPALPHPDLRLLLSTSGSTGDPKLVRLSQINIDANAAAICEYLGLSKDDVGLTTLPLHYSYGLSVLHSHLAAGAALVLAPTSVTDPAFERLCRACAVTNLAFVPHQLNLLETRGTDLGSLPALRLVTQAGGRLAPDKVRAWAAAGKRGGWDFFVMYGQTEAAPRMAYLPPVQAANAADTIGRAIPGGQFRIEDEAGAAVTRPGQRGELIYDGPNVMLGYAERRADLALGRTIDCLRTGDIAEWNGQGLVRIVGRAKRFVKLYGLRLNLDQIDGMIEAAGFSGRAVGLADRLAIMTDRPDQTEAISALIAEGCDLPRQDIFVGVMPDMPLLPNGKTDLRTITSRAQATAAAERIPPENPASLAADFSAATRRRTIRPSDTFAALGGDSLAHLHLMLAIEARLGHVPADWDRMSVAELDSLGAGSTPRATAGRQQLDPAVLARLFAITCVILFHLNLWPIVGGTWLLVLLTGYSLARFQAASMARGAALDVLRNLLWPVLPIYFAILLVYDQVRHEVPAEMYLLFANSVTDRAPPLIAPYWFISLYAQIALTAAALCLVPAVRHAIARSRFAFGLIAALLACGLSALLQLVVLGCDGADCEAAVRAIPLTGRTLPLCLPFLFAGWSIQAAENDRQRLQAMLVLLMAVTVFPIRQPGFHAIISLGAASLVLPVTILVPGWMARASRRLAAATLFVYLVHNGVIWAFKVVTPAHAVLGPLAASVAALTVCFALGLGLDWAYRRSEAVLLRLLPLPTGPRSSLP